MKNLLLLLSANVMAINIAISQNGVSVNTTGAAADKSAMLDVSGTNKGMLTPRMTEVKNFAIINPATGLLIYQTDNNIGFWYYNGTAWMQAIGPQGNAGAGGATVDIGPTGADGATAQDH